MKIIRVETCVDCEDYCHAHYDEPEYCRKVEKDLLPGGIIPDWCPLEDAPSDEIGPCEHEWEPCNAVKCENCGLIID